MTAKQFLHNHGQTAALADADKSIKLFRAKMQQGLDGNCLSIPMIPTYLVDVDRSKIRPDVKRILIDAGGTNFRVAVGYFDAQGNPHIEDICKTAMPSADGTLYTKRQFYDAIARNISAHLCKAEDIGFCFSYQVAMDKDVDGEVVMFSKEINAPEVIGTRVGYETLQACKQYSDTDRKIVILNDTVATLLGGMAVNDGKFSAYLGYIYGTGTNVCYIEDVKNITKINDVKCGRMLINTECGNFDGFALGEFDAACIKRTAVPDRQLFEKMSSGKYLADIIAEAYFRAKQEGAFKEEVTLAPFELKDVSALLDGGEFPCKFRNKEDLEFACGVAEELIDRAAKMGAIVNSALAIASCKDKTLPVAIVAEGTTFNKLTGYRAAFEKYFTEILSAHGITYQIIQGKDLNLVGTLMATMVL